jgi:hypothetical protein
LINALIMTSALYCLGIEKLAVLKSVNESTLIFARVASARHAM